MHPTRYLITGFFVLTQLVLALAGCTGVSSVPEVRTESPSPSRVMTATPTRTSMPETPTHTPIPPSETPQPTGTPTPSPTIEPPNISVKQDVACLNGPGIVYGIRTYLTGGSSPIPLGHTGDESWWAVEVAELGLTCWVDALYITVEGDGDVLPVFTPEATPTSQQSPTPKLNGVRYFLIAPDTGGPFGCGDGLVYFFSDSPPSGIVEKDIKNALHALFKLKVKFVGQYYNPVYNAHLIVKEVNFDPSTGKVVIQLSGSIPKPADVCEADRIHDVVWETVRKFPEVNSVGIWVGNFLLGDLIAVGDR